MTEPICASRKRSRSEDEESRWEPYRDVRIQKLKGVESARGRSPKAGLKRDARRA